MSAWCEQNQTVLGQWAIAAKSNEITAIPELLELPGALPTAVASAGGRDAGAALTRRARATRKLGSTRRPM